MKPKFKICSICYAKFQVNLKHQKYCSTNCRKHSDLPNANAQHNYNNNQAPKAEDGTNNV